MKVEFVIPLISLIFMIILTYVYFKKERILS